MADNIVTPPPDVIPPDPNEPVFVITRKQWDGAKAAAGHFLPTIARYWPFITNLLIATGLVTGGAVYVLKPNQPTTQPVTVNVAPVDGKSVPIEPIPVGKKETTMIAPMKLIVYTLDGVAIDTKPFIGLPVSVKTDAKEWPAGMYTLYGLDKKIVFPAGVLYTSDMKSIIDATHYDKIDDLVSLVKAHSQGK